jgi:hypothetical protein
MAKRPKKASISSLITLPEVTAALNSGNQFPGLLSNNCFICMNDSALQTRKCMRVKMTADSDKTNVEARGGVCSRDPGVHSAQTDYALNPAIYQRLSYYTLYFPACNGSRNKRIHKRYSIFVFEENKQCVHSKWLGLLNGTILR